MLLQILTEPHPSNIGLRNHSVISVVHGEVHQKSLCARVHLRTITHVCGAVCAQVRHKYAWVKLMSAPSLQFISPAYPLWNEGYFGLTTVQPARKNQVWCRVRRIVPSSLVYQCREKVFCPYLEPHTHNRYLKRNVWFISITSKRCCVRLHIYIYVYHLRHWPSFLQSASGPSAWHQSQIEPTWLDTPIPLGLSTCIA